MTKTTQNRNFWAVGAQNRTQKSADGNTRRFAVVWTIETPEPLEFDMPAEDGKPALQGVGCKATFTQVEVNRHLDDKDVQPEAFPCEVAEITITGSRVKGTRDGGKGDIVVQATAIKFGKKLAG